MSVNKKGRYWWIDLWVHKQRYQLNTEVLITETGDEGREQARKFEKTLKTSLLHGTSLESAKKDALEASKITRLPILTTEPVKTINWEWHNAISMLPKRDCKVICYNSNDQEIFIGWFDEADWMGWTTINEHTGEYVRCHVDFWAYIVAPDGQIYTKF